MLEYKIVRDLDDLSGQANSPEEFDKLMCEALEELSKDGWSLVVIDGLRHIFSRPKDE